MFLEILLFVVFIFIVLQIVNGIKNRKKLEAPIVFFNQRTSILMAISSGALLALGLLYILQEVNVTSVIYVLLGLAFIYMAYERFAMGINGIYFKGNLFTWNEIKKWRFEKEDKFLVLEIQKNGKRLDRMIPIRPEDKDGLHKIIRRNKKK